VYGPNVPVESHTGDRHALLRRFGRKATTAVLEGRAGIASLGPKLLKWVSDTRNLRAAWDFLRHYGGTAPGPNGMTYDDLTTKEAWGLCGAHGQAIRIGWIDGHAELFGIESGRLGDQDRGWARLCWLGLHDSDSQ